MISATKVKVLGNFEGLLTHETCRILDDLCSGYLKEGVVNLVLELHGVDSIEQDGIRTLANRAQALREYGGDLKLAGAKPAIVKAIEFAELEWAFDLCETLEMALEQIKQGCRPRVLVSFEEGRRRRATLRGSAFLSSELEPRLKRMQHVAAGVDRGIEQLEGAGLLGAMKVHEAMTRAAM